MTFECVVDGSKRKAPHAFGCLSVFVYSPKRRKRIWWTFYQRSHVNGQFASEIIFPSNETAEWETDLTFGRCDKAGQVEEAFRFCQWRQAALTRRQYLPEGLSGEDLAAVKHHNTQHAKSKKSGTASSLLIDAGEEDPTAMPLLKGVKYVQCPSAFVRKLREITREQVHSSLPDRGCTVLEMRTNLKEVAKS